ncbi:MAG: fumarylacetoacetate hydrolase family protein, partial [Burkholderiales bacterium]|nr:fumarylacetoacetate hydrolase family protein [Burkholderiales bacterium]
GLAVLTADLPQGCSAERALDGVRLLLLANHASLPQVPQADDDGALQPPAAFAPVAVTPDELGAAWDGGRAALRLRVDVDGRRLGRIDTAPAQRWSFGALVARAAQARPLPAGSLVASGALDGADPAQGFASRRGQREHELATGGAARAPWLGAGSVVTIEAFAADGASVFGAIAQRVLDAGEAAPAPPAPGTA